VIIAGVGYPSAVQIYVFNGDADGLCALQQLALSEPASLADARLISGPKRQTRLLKALQAKQGDIVTVLDVSLAINRSDVEGLLAVGADVHYFDHHHVGEPLHHPRLCAHIDTSPSVCTSVIVDHYLAGAHRAWAVVGAYGDNLDATAEALADQAGIAGGRRPQLRELGIALNYNSYADSVEDMFFDPITLHRALIEHRDPLAFARETPVFRALADGHAADMQRLKSLQPRASGSHAAVFVLPAESWARRAIGVFANNLAGRWPDRAHAVLLPNADGGMLVSVRAPKVRPYGASKLCCAYATGGGREGAAGINHLDASEVEGFVTRFFEHFRASAVP
jgi:hypothetical protein